MCRCCFCLSKPISHHVRKTYFHSRSLFHLYSVVLILHVCPDNKVQSHYPGSAGKVGHMYSWFVFLWIQHICDYNSRTNRADIWWLITFSVQQQYNNLYSVSEVRKENIRTAFGPLSEFLYSLLSSVIIVFVIFLHVEQQRHNVQFKIHTIYTKYNNTTQRKSTKIHKKH